MSERKTDCRESEIVALVDFIYIYARNVESEK